MRANKINLGYIFELDTRYMAPLYQRPYVWEKDRNWEPLWESVKDVADTRYESKPPHPYFLGAIVLDQLPNAMGEVPARQIIDGQQRLTTIQLMLAAFRDLAQDLCPEYQQNFKRLTENHLPATTSNRDGVFKVMPTNADQAKFMAVMRDARTQEDEDHLFIQAYEYFYDQAKLWVESSGFQDIAKRFMCLQSAVKEDLVVVVIDLDKDDDAQLIFETLNALGTPLLPADLVKNYLFHRAQLDPGRSGDERAKNLYDKYWQEFDNESSYWRKTVRQGRLKRPRIDNFLHHYLTLKCQKDVLAGHLFGTFKNMVEARAVALDELLREFKEYSDVFQSFDSYAQGTREALFIDRLADLDSTACYPFLLELFRKQMVSEERLQIIIDIESYLIRRAACRLTTKGYNRIFIDLIKYVDERGLGPQQVREFLASRKGDSAKWPGDADFREAVTLEPLYKRSRAAVTVILKNYEKSLASRKTERAQIDTSELTIEHIMPQGWRKNWPLTDQSIDQEEAEERRDEVIHTLGNLTLLTDRLNTAQSNRPWSTKKEILERYSILAMNRELCSLDDWSESAMANRGLRILDAALLEWPCPSRGDDVDDQGQDSGDDADETTWLKSVRRILRSLGKQEFSIEDIYQHEPELARIYPNNAQVRSRIDHTLQHLQSRGIIEHMGEARFRYPGLRTSDSSSNAAKAVDIMDAFYDAVDKVPSHKLHRRWSYSHGKKMYSVLGDLRWNEVLKRKSEIDSWLKTNGSLKNQELSPRTISMAWMWLARAFEYAKEQGAISDNPLGRLDEAPKSGSGLDTRDLKIGG
jgi:hypothetical protein